MKLLKSLLLLSLSTAMFVACNDKFDDPKKYASASIDPEQIITIKELKAKYTGSGNPLSISEDDDVLYIAGKVASSDHEGNLYKQLYIQDHTSGICLKIGKSGLYNFYKLGQTVYVKCNGLTLGDYGGMKELGCTPNPNTAYETSYIDVPYLINKHIFAGEYGEPIEPDVITISEFSQDKLGTLIRINNLIFEATDYPANGTISTWAQPAIDNADPVTVSQKFVVQGGTASIIVRTSGYSRFAGTEMPTTPVDLVGILSIYRGTYQLTLRDLNDVIPSAN